jgi:hypothetical protein
MGKTLGEDIGCVEKLVLGFSTRSTSMKESLTENSMENTGALKTPFEQWWESLSGAQPLVGYKSLAAQAFDAGYLVAVKAHDASGCPRIFMGEQA